MENEPDVARNYQKVPEGFAFRLEKEQKPFPMNTDKINLKKFVASLKGRTEHLEIGIKDIAALNITNIGRYALYTNQLAEAEKAFAKALEVSPTNAQAQEGYQAVMARKK